MANIHIVLNVAFTGGGTDEEQSSTVWFCAYAVPWLQHNCVVSAISSASEPGSWELYIIIEFYLSN